MNRPTCAMCHQYGSDGECHRPHPAIGAGLNWPRPTPQEWCVAHQDWLDYVATRDPNFAAARGDLRWGEPDRRIVTSEQLAQIEEESGNG